MIAITVDDERPMLNALTDIVKAYWIVGTVPTPRLLH